MAEVQLATPWQRQVWSNKFLSEYVRESGFMPYMGRSSTSIIQMRAELETAAGKLINIPLLGRLKGRGVRGAQVLDGQEDDMSMYNAQVAIDWVRNGIRVPKSTSFTTEIDLLDAAKPLLRQWSSEVLRDELIDNFNSIIVPGGGSNFTDTTVNYSAATSTQRNAYLAANADRVLFGHQRSNNSGNVWATSLANVTASGDKMTAAVGSLAKRMAKTADPHIRPFKSPNSGQEYYVMFLNSFAFRDLKTDPVITAANRDARPRDVAANPIFQDGDLIYDGIIYHEVPELSTIVYSGAGASGGDVAPSFLCGQGAVAVAYGQQPTPRTDFLKDYGFRPGVAIEELRGQRKLSWNNGVQYGIVTVITSAAADA